MDKQDELDNAARGKREQVGALHPMGSMGGGLQKRRGRTSLSFQLNNRYQTLDVQFQIITW